jgi:hypothetical protein
VAGLVLKGGSGIGLAFLFLSRRETPFCFLLLPFLPFLSLFGVEMTSLHLHRVLHPWIERLAVPFPSSSSSSSLSGFSSRNERLAIASLAGAPPLLLWVTLCEQQQQQQQ